MSELINGHCLHGVPFTSCAECSAPKTFRVSALTEALEDALEREPAGPTKFQCPHCRREHTDTQWRCLEWLQFAGGARSGRMMVAVEVRRCVCSLPIGRECVLPMVEVLP